MRRPERRLAAGLCLLLAGIAPAAAEEPPHPSAAAATTGPAAGQPRDALADTAAALAGEADALRQRSISLAEAMQRHEAALSLLESRLATLGEAESRIEADLKRHEKDRRALLTALVQLARNQPEALVLSSRDPVDIERSALLMGGTLPPLDRAAAKLRDDLATLGQLRQAVAAAEQRHRDEQKSLDVQQFRLAEVISRRASLRHSRPDDAAREQHLAAVAAEATSLKDLIERLDAVERAAPAPASGVRAAPQPVAAASQVASIAVPEKPATAAAPPAEKVAAPATMVPHLRAFGAAQGKVLVPASGRLALRFGKPTEAGTAAKGLTYITRAGAQVVSPYDGRILFAGPFRGYGQILIIEHSDGYDSLLAGLARVDVAVGQWLVAGEPVGTMPKDEDKPRLYLELRHDGQPINPLPWLATSNEKVSG